MHPSKKTLFGAQSSPCCSFASIAHLLIKAQPVLLSKFSKLDGVFQIFRLNALQSSDQPLSVPSFLFTRFRSRSPPVSLGGLFFIRTGVRHFFLGGQRLTEHRWEHHENTTTMFVVKNHCAEEDWYQTT